jgi:SAM-dependent methyltransferase
MSSELIAIQTALRDRIPVPDEEFDAQFPKMQRYRSSVHWTPIEVAMRVAELLEPSPGGQVLDVGSGVGKACIVGALMTGTMWFGIERSPPMVRAAKMTARRFGVEHRTRFVVGEAFLVDWSPFGGIYLYNPFAEALFDGVIDAGERRETYLDEVHAVERKLAEAKIGTHVVTYHGFGGDMPESFECVVKEKVREDEVCLWLKRE